MVPSILNCDSAERRKRYRQALRQERIGLIVQAEILSSPVSGLRDIAIMCAGLFVVSAMCAIMIFS